MLYTPVCNMCVTSRIQGNFLIFLTKTDKKLDTENFRMILQEVWKIYKKP